jgi:hypothetical protein
MIVAGDGTFTVELAVEFGAIVRQVATISGRRDRRVLDDWSPLEPYRSKSRPWPLEGANQVLWQLKPEPRLQVALSIRRFDIYGVELPAEELETALLAAKATFASALLERLVFNDAVVEGTFDTDDELRMSESERELVLHCAVQLAEV